ncbi:hypothetical protein BJY52DRAFT_1298981 [Lactarius psammicola]|nr:hypothetical protein BJY52DRAFT_1298981 [Lactarius psammicola]
MSDYVVPSFESLQVHSPLESLVRRTSSRRRPNTTQTPLAQDRMDHYSPVPVLDAPPKHHIGLPPPSPLLHTRFRASIATQSSSNTSAETYDRTRSHVANGSQDIPYDDDISLYSVATASIPHSDITGSSSRGKIRNLFQRTPPRRTSDTSNATGGRYERRSTDSATDPFMYQQPRSQNLAAAVPTVVQGNALSSPTPDSQLFAGRTPSAVPRNVNFSRPVKPGGAAEESKRQVLARNAFRSTLTHSKLSLLEAAQSVSTKISESPSKFSLSPSSSSMPSTRRPYNPRAAASSQLAPLTHNPLSVSSSLSSLYSAYSYYQLDSPSPSPSPTTDTLQVPPSPHAPPPRTPPPRTPSPLNSTPAPKGNPEQLVLADQLLQEGIQHHEANRLREAAAAFERSAKTPGGTGVGMLMWGLTLRHGWGCPKDEKAAVGDLEHARTGIDASAVRGELVLAIYEVGQCFFQGWGVKKDQKMAMSYFQVAAKLGDMDAQQELAFCYANGRGCKKDRKEAAKWYRAAVRLT